MELEYCEVCGKSAVDVQGDCRYCNNTDFYGDDDDYDDESFF